MAPLIILCRHSERIGNIKSSFFQDHRYTVEVRSAVSLLLNLALALAFIQAPFFHVHEHESTKHHPGGLMHCHLPHHGVIEPSKPALCDFDPDDDAHSQDWFSAAFDGNQSPAIFELRRLEIVPHRVAEPMTDSLILHGHDPPSLSSSTPRAPPA